jgi:hypothetical protein
MYQGHGPKKILFLLLFGGFTAALTFSAAFAYAHLEHDCLGYDCPVCIQIQSAQNLLKSLGLSGGGLLLGFLGSAVLTLPKPSLLSICPVTAIALKVRLNT